jgi:hypothetical protein
MIRLAVSGDVQQIAEIHVQSWNETYTGMIKQEIIERENIENEYSFGNRFFRIKIIMYWCMNKMVKLLVF